MSGERVILSEIKTIQEYVIFLKEKFIYNWTKELVGEDDFCLDLGCGDGYRTKLLTSKDREAVGVDIDGKTESLNPQSLSEQSGLFKIRFGELSGYSSFM